jgi:hypothetical protein
MIIMLGVTLLFACDKATNASAKLDGEWELISYKLTISNGMSYLGTGDGSLIFSDIESENSDRTYLFQFNQSVNGAVMIKEEAGFFSVSYEPGFPELSMNTSTGTSTSYRILTLNKSDLQLEGSDSLGRIHTFLFRRLK